MAKMLQPKAFHKIAEKNLSLDLDKYWVTLFGKGLRDKTWILIDSFEAQWRIYASVT